MTAPNLDAEIEKACSVWIEEQCENRGYSNKRATAFYGYTAGAHAFYEKGVVDQIAQAIEQNTPIFPTKEQMFLAFNEAHKEPVGPTQALRWAYGWFRMKAS